SVSRMRFCLCVADTSSSEVYTLSLHDALPISVVAERLARLSKPAVACFLGATELVGAGSVVLASGLEDAVAKTAALAGESFEVLDRKSTRLNSSHVSISYAVFCLKKKNRQEVT